MNPTRTTLGKSALAASVAAAFPGIALSQNVASVDFAIGNPTVTSPDGRTLALGKGTNVRVGDLISTGKGRVQLRFADGAQMALQPDTDFKVEQFRFAEQGQGDDSVLMNLVKGGMRTITGLIGRSNRTNYALKTPSATIGIRGTEFTAEFREALRAFCVNGLIAINNGAGTLLLAGGQGAFVANPNTPPARDDTKPSLPTISKQEMEVLLSLAGVDPKNPTQDFNPVVTLQTVLAQLATPSSPVILTGEFTGNWAAAGDYSGMAAEVNSTVKLDASGKLTQFLYDSGEGIYTVTPGTATVTSSGNDGIIAWGNWMNGMTSGGGGFGSADLVTYGPMHYVVGLPVSSMPTTGIGTYNMIGSSASCIGGGCTGVAVNASSLSVNFGSMQVALAMNLTVTGGSDAGLHTFAGSPLTLDGTGKFSGSGDLLGGVCNGYLSTAGFLSGSGAVRAGMAWNGSLFGGTYLYGANAYKKQ